MNINFLKEYTENIISNNWGLGIGDLGLANPHPHPPIPNPQNSSCINTTINFLIKKYIYNYHYKK